MGPLAAPRDRVLQRPAQFVGHPTSTQEPAPKTVSTNFRDRDQLPASANLGAQIEGVLRASRFLIVVCHPTPPNPSG